MFNIGGGELIVIMLIALIVLGPQRLPDAARQVGKTMGDLRRLSSGFQNEMKGALNTADDPTRVAARRNVLAKEAPPSDAADSAVGAVSAQARKTPLKAATAKNGTAVTSPTTARASAKAPSTTKATAKAAAKKTPAKKVAAKKAPATKTAAKKTPAKASPAAKKATPAAKKKSAPVVSKAAPRRTKA